MKLKASTFLAAFAVILTSFFITSCSNGLSPSVEEYCQLIDSASNALKNGNYAQISSEIDKKINEEFINDDTVLTSADKELLTESMKHLYKAFWGIATKYKTPTEEMRKAYDEGIEKLKLQIEDSKTLGQFVEELIDV